MPQEDAPLLPRIPGPLVLVVDDEVTPRSIVSRMVGAMGYSALGYRSGRDALRFDRAGAEPPASPKGEPWPTAT